MSAFYNEFDPYAAQYLRNLIADGLIAPGIVDERSIEEIEPYELAAYTQVHMFAGVGIWSGALRAAGWPDNEPIWTGSCPCQPFSNAGKRKGFEDARHLWPVWRNLIEICNPPRVAGEQVASKDGRVWLDAVSSDLEALGFAFGASDLCAAGFGGAHIRQRNYFAGLADDDDAGRQGWAGMPECGTELSVGPGSLDGRLAYSDGEPTGRDGRAAYQPKIGDGTEDCHDNRPVHDSNINRLAYGESVRRGEEPENRRRSGAGNVEGKIIGRSGDSNINRLVDPDLPCQYERQSSGREQSLYDVRNRRNANPSIRDPGEVVPDFWYDVDWLLCRNPTGEPSWRPVEPGAFPLAHGVPQRMGKLRAYGNALDFETAKGFCEVLREICLGI